MLDLVASGAIVLGIAGVVALLSAANAVPSNHEPEWPQVVLTASAKLVGLVARSIGQRG